MRLLPLKPTLTIVQLGLLLAAIERVPALSKLKLVEWPTPEQLLAFERRLTAAEPPQAQPQPHLKAGPRLPNPILDEQRQMDSFYAALYRAEGGEGIVKILHYGDSPVTADLITADVRMLLQSRFGDAGHGFCLIAKPWAWYHHQGIDIRGDGWSIDPAMQPSIRDGMFGLGGVAFRGWAGAWTRIRVRQAHAGIEIAFLHQPEGGEFEVLAGSQLLGVVQTGAAVASSGFSAFPLPENAREVVIRVRSGQVRLFGLLWRSGRPGVMYHSLGVNGAYVSMLARLFSEEHWREQLRHYQPDLVIVNYGTNESMYPPYVEKASARELTEAIRRIRAAVPQASILVMSPMDRGQRIEGGRIGTPAAIPRLVAIQQKVAQDNGCAFFNTFAAMGGEGTMGRWHEAVPRLVGADFIHPMPAGARLIADLLYRALLDGYSRYKMGLIERQLRASK